MYEIQTYLTYNMFQVTATTPLYTDFTGTRVAATKPVLVVEGMLRGSVNWPPNADHFEQVAIPLNKLGTTYYMMPTPISPAVRYDIIHITGNSILTYNYCSITIHAINISYS